MTRWYYHVMFLCLTSCLLCVGCSGGEKQLPTAKASGNVSFQGTPLESGTITFFPVEGGKHAIGMIQKEGAFALSTFKSGDGAVLGKHKVVLNVSYDRPDGVPVPDSVPRVPAKYADRETTPLTAEVTVDGENKFSFEVSP